MGKLGVFVTVGVISCGGGQPMAEPPPSASFPPSASSPTATVPASQAPSPCKSSRSGNTRSYCDGTEAVFGDSRVVKSGDVGRTVYEVTKKDATGRVLLYASEYWDSSLTDEGQPEAGLFLVFEAGKCHQGNYASRKKQGLWRTWNDESQCQLDEARKAGVKNGDRKFSPLPAKSAELDEVEVFVDDAPAPWPTVAKALLEDLMPKKPFGWTNNPKFLHSSDDVEENDESTREFLRTFESAKRRHPEAAGTPELTALTEKASVLTALGRLARKEARKRTPTSTWTGQPLTTKEVDELKSLCEKQGQAQACTQYAEHHATTPFARLEWFERACKLGSGEGCSSADGEILRLPDSTKLKERRREILSIGCKTDITDASRMCNVLKWMGGAGAAIPGGCDPLTGRHVVSNGPNFSVACEKADGPACVARKVGTGAVSEAQVRAAASSCCCDFH